MNKTVTDRFVDAWGQMGAVWGLNTSMARVHGLLLASAEPLGLDEIARSLEISRGNASMCLKELRNWGVVRRVKRRGERKDYYLTEPDVWKMFFAIARERKRREFDPALAVVREMLAGAGRNSPRAVVERFRQMQEFLAVLDGIAGRFLSEEEQARAVLAALSGRPSRSRA